MLRYAYCDCKKASIEIQNHLKQNVHDRQYYENIHKMISSCIDRIENDLPLEWLEESIDRNNYKLGKSQNEVEYRK